MQELILINPKIIEKDTITQINNEQCLSLPGIKITTKRYVFVTVINNNEKLEEMILPLQDLFALVVQHEIDHLNGILIVSRKWNDINKRK